MKTKTRPERNYEPSVLVLHEKHGDYYLNALTPEALCKSALSVLKGRMESGDFYNEPEYEKPQQPELSREKAYALPVGKVKDLAERQWIEYNRALRDYEEENKQYNDIKKAIENEDGRMAYQILCSRSDYEYERISLELLREEY